MHRYRSKKKPLQLFWGIALMAAGVAVFFKTYQVIPSIQGLNKTSATICIYLMGAILLGGGLKKILGYFSNSRPTQSQPDLEAEKDIEDR
jgi:uncharacterized membrane protein HdeD (DUF308 family)